MFSINCKRTFYQLNSFVLPTAPILYKTTDQYAAPRNGAFCGTMYFGYSVVSKEHQPKLSGQGCAGSVMIRLEVACLMQHFSSSVQAPKKC